MAERFRRTFELVDLVRVDHFRGFVSYWAIPAGNRPRRAAAGGAGPGAELFRAVEQELGGLPLIAEDLGLITPPVYRLRDELGLPGMVVLLWASRPPRATRTGPRTTVATRSSTPAPTTPTRPPAGSPR